MNFNIESSHCHKMKLSGFYMLSPFVTDLMIKACI